MAHQSLFERHPNITLLGILSACLLALYGVCSWKFINNAYTEYEQKSIKMLVKQFIVGKVVETNIGRFIVLREFPPSRVLYERPTRDMMNNVAPNTIERKYYKITTDQHGFIGPSEIHPNADLSIVFLGGSTTECLYVDEPYRFPYLVGRAIEEKTQKKINSYNAGKSANESHHSINHLFNKILPMQPSIVVMMHNINDLVMLRLQGTYDYKDSSLSHVQNSKTLLTRFGYPVRTHDKNDADLIALFSKNLKTFVSICRIHGIEPVLMTQANRVDNDHLYHEFNQTIREVAKREGVVLIDLAQSIPKEPEYLYDHYHYTAKGSQLAAKIISDVLVKNIIG